MIYNRQNLMRYFSRTLQEELEIEETKQLEEILRKLYTIKVSHHSFKKPTIIIVF